MKTAVTEQDGTSTPLTVDSASAVFEGLLSDEEDTEPRETNEAEVADRPESEDHDEQPTGDDAEASSDAEGDTASDETETTDDEQPDTRPVIVDGKEVGRVTFDEAVKGYMRTADHTRKTQAVAQQKRELEAATVTARTRAEQYLQLIGKVEQALGDVDKEPDPESPTFAVDWARWQREQRRRAAVKSERERVERERQEHEDQQLSGLREQETEKLMEALPELRDVKKAQTIKAELVQYGQSIGFTADELMGIVDHRAILALRKAMLFDRAEAKRRAVAPKVKQAIKAAKPGAAKPDPRANAGQRALSRLAKSGRKDDATAVFYELEE